MHGSRLGCRSRVAKGKMTEEAMHEILRRITVGEYADCSDCELVIEAVTEKLQTKQKVFKALENVCSPDCIFASWGLWLFAILSVWIYA